VRKTSLKKTPIQTKALGIWFQVSKKVSAEEENHLLLSNSRSIRFIPVTFISEDESDENDKDESKEKNDPVQGATPEVIPNPDASYPEPEKNFFALGDGSDQDPNPDTSNPEPDTMSSSPKMALMKTV
jgi:hypothetical protein